MTDLSPAAQAVKDAAVDAYWLFHPAQAAAIIRAAADQLAYGHGSWAGTSAIIDEDKLLAIAAELEQPEPEFTAEEVEMIQAPWSYLSPSQPTSEENLND